MGMLLAAMGAMAIMTSYGDMNEVREMGKRPLLPSPPKKKRPPSGSKEYFFNSEGEFSTEKMLKADCVFTCFSINDKNAVRKFKKWKNG